MEPLKYLETYDSKKTVVTYKGVINHFLTNIYGKGKLELLAERYFHEKRDHKADLQNFLAQNGSRGCISYSLRNPTRWISLPHLHWIINFSKDLPLSFVSRML